MTEQLKPCPFCGGINVIHSGYRMYCHACGAEGPDADSADESAAIAAWNRRAQPAQAGAEPAPSAVVCGRCDGTGLDARYCNYQCEKCDGSGQAGAEPVAWRGYTVTNGYTLHHYYGEAHRVASQIEPLYTHPPARVPLTEGELLSMWSGGDERFMRPVLGKNKILAFAHAIIAAYEVKNGIGGGK